MAGKRPTKKTATTTKKNTANQTYDLDQFKKDHGISGKSQKMKEPVWYKFNDGFAEAIGVPGIPKGNGSQFIGFSDTGKSTGIYESIVAAQKVGDLPIIVDTEGNWNWEYAKSIGFEFEEVLNEETGEPDIKGDFLFFQDDDLIDMYECYDYKEGKMKTSALRYEAVIEDVARLFNHFADLQLSGKLKRNILFVWDSVGSIDCFQSAISSVSNNQWNAGVMKRAFQSFFKKITRTRRADYPYDMSIVSVNKVWLSPNAVGQPTVKQSGGEAWRFYNRFIVHMGGKTTSSAKRKTITVGGDSHNFAVLTSIEVIKNQVNAVTKTGKICSTPHGFVHPDKLTKYQQDNKAYFMGLMGKTHDTPDDDIKIITTGDDEAPDYDDLDDVKDIMKNLRPKE